jgi:RNA 2',3'-cyclic 3'-phosphodiesterase
VIRAFLAVPLPEPLRDRLRQLHRTLRAELPAVRWSNPETLHLTLRFFGDIDEESLEKIGEIMLSIGRLHVPFAVDLTGLGAFPAADRARVFWLGVRDRGELAALHDAFEQRLPEAGIPREQRPFTPHLTLGRYRGRGLAAAPVLARFQDLACGRLPVERLVLYESRLKPGGALHLPRHSVILGDSSAGAETP